MTATSDKTSKALIENFVKAFQTMNIEALDSLMDQDIIMYVANAYGAPDKVEGRDSLIKRFQEVDYTQAEIKLTITQILTIESEKIMAMIHVTACKNNIDFENFAAFVFYIKNNKINFIWQVDGKPADSDKFWKS